MVILVGNAISIFIMDITDSTKHNNGKELSAYLSFWENIINELGSRSESLTVRANYRMGDEIFLIADDYVTAYTVATYMYFLWKYPKNKPYFGISSGYINDPIEDIDLERWNHSIIKEARIANESIKNAKSRHQAIKVYVEGNEESKCKIEEKVINHILKLQHQLAEHQTQKQKEITGLYMLYGAQNTIASLLNKSKATISNQFSKGATSIILESIAQLQEILIFSQLSSDGFENKKLLEERLKDIQEELKLVLLKNIHILTEQYEIE
ncbi:hypothetical protein [Psychrobacillus sp. NPDC096389]|uniref:hypothetical protein n=1 Tax=Psychrobacillus sp. NPDC096389 TaxID=3364490 RepID=UPI0037FD82BB